MCRTVKAVLVVLCLAAVSTLVTPESAAAQGACWNCKLELDEQGQVEFFGCSRNDSGGAQCDTSCSGSSCECTPTGSCGIVQRDRLLPDGTVVAARAGDEASSKDVLAQAARDCSGAVVSRVVTASARRVGEASTRVVEL